MNTIIYYFSGTGNSLKVAKDLSQQLENAELMQINQEQMISELITNADIIGFVLPTIFSGVPKLVGQFIKQLNIINSSAYIFVIATHGDRNGMGIVFEQIDKLLKDKERSLAASFGIHMPHNMPEKDHVTTTQEKNQLFEEEVKRIIEIANDIKNYKKVPYHVHKIKSFFERMTYNGMNKLSDKNPLDKGFTVDEKCISCTYCYKICPANNIDKVDGKPKWKLENCQFCFACIQWCPQTAIQFKKRTLGVERYHHPDIKINEMVHKKEK